MFRSLAAVVLAMAVLSTTATTAMTRELDLQGHRGTRGLAPENTLAAFARALTIGVGTLELDLGVSRDGVVVVSHNMRLNPEITRRGGAWLSASGAAISSLSVAELGAYDVGRIDPASRYAARFPDQTPADGARIPTLADVVRLVRRSGNETVRLNIETKLTPAEPGLTLGPGDFAKAVLDTVRDLGMAGRVTIQSFDWRTLREVQRRAPAVPTAYLSVSQRWLDNLQRGRPGPSPWTAGFDIDDFGGSVPRLVKAAGGTIWSPYHREVDAARIKQAHELGLTVKVWTVNKKARMNELIDMGVDGIITDYPDRLRQVMEAHGMRLPASTPVRP